MKKFCCAVLLALLLAGLPGAVDADTAPGTVRSAGRVRKQQQRVCAVKNGERRARCLTLYVGPLAYVRGERVWVYEDAGRLIGLGHAGGGAW